MTTQAIPQRASRVADVEQEYDDNVNSTPRSALHFRPTQAQTDTQPLESNRVGGRSRVLLYVLLIACVAFLLSGINSPLLSGNVITLHVPMVWLVACVAILITSLALIKR